MARNGCPVVQKEALEAGERADLALVVRSIAIRSTDLGARRNPPGRSLGCSGRRVSSRALGLAGSEEDRTFAGSQGICAGRRGLRATPGAAFAGGSHADREGCGSGATHRRSTEAATVASKRSRRFDTA